MKRRKIKVIIAVICFLNIGLMACSVDKTKMDAKYVSIYDDSHYLIFKKDGSLKSSMWTDSERKPLDCFIYTLDEDGVVTAIDTTEYAGQDSFDEYEIGILYKDYICLRCEGAMSKDYKDMTLINKLDENFIRTFNLKKDKTYEYIITIGGEDIVENGTYKIKGNEIITTSDEGKKTTFINIDGTTYCIEYKKQ